MSDTPRTDAFFSEGPRTVNATREFMEGLERELAALHEEIARLNKLVYVPGAWRCAKCKCGLISNTLYVATGAMAANNTPQECPNGCGPMWRLTERDAGNEACDRLEALAIKLRESDARVERDPADAHDAARYRKLRAAKLALSREGPEVGPEWEMALEVTDDAEEFDAIVDAIENGASEEPRL